MLKIPGDPSRDSSEAGAAMVEAAVVLPIFLVTMMMMMQIAIFCFHLLQFQYEVSEIVRQTFVLNAKQRAIIAGQSGNMEWQPFVVSQINKKAEHLRLATKAPADSASIIFTSSKTEKTCKGWSCASKANPGHVFSLSITLKEPIFGSMLAGISLPNMSVNVKAIAFVQRSQSEDAS
jgi:hypothetical protein